ncbi:Decaprenylphosphoryl-beta-D-ribose oxidase [Starkeya nomas]|uniref:Decaprenylphosphoryl-beta-D-ribose oxidase n=1 Tax=Starkeya nomas TaxID=2666134 RepID=A0A5S9Q7P7_9HYPH|nr:FAD-binding oxidoreductase [Starkeya nomas]CAA0113935.1 Decaprenylphosphoryl-beta-D-ribose oxidase [Starkeya nomas]
MTGFVDTDQLVSWGRVLRARHDLARPAFLDELPALLHTGAASTGKVLAGGLRRSYGDSCLNADGALIDVSALDRFIAFDPATRLLTAEAGVSLAQVLAFAIPRGLFLPVTPGTKFVTLGGAVANDVHGKNHHGAGTFGRWVRALTLLRSDGSNRELTPEDESGLFAATIGGLGLTGVIATVTVELQPISSSHMVTETIPFANLGEFFRLARDSDAAHAYSVAWIDCLASGGDLGRGLLTLADHAAEGPLEVAGRQGPSIPFDFPEIALNRYSIAAFNRLYHYAGAAKAGRRVVSYDPYFYPLDAIRNWNRLYGRRGMYQYQSVVPPEAAPEATREMLRTIARAGTGSFLAVLKTFGAVASPGLLSFPREGTTLALDFPNRGPETLALLSRLDAIVREAKGRLYPAKDGRLPPDLFHAGYPAAERFAQHVDPGISSSFWRRMQS